jgi:hypothetical protein
MAEETALFIAGPSGSPIGHPANVAREFIKSLIPTQGVIGSGDLAVSQSGPSMNVSVAAGAAVVAGTEAATQGSYYCPNAAPVTLAIAASDPTNGRHDLVVAQVRDGDYSTPSYAWRLFVVTGTAAATPLDPALPANSLSLARVRVDAGASSIPNAKIDDLRVLAVPFTRLVAGNPLAPTGATSPTRYVGAWGTSGAPASGTFAVGDFGFDSNEFLWTCIGAGSPGTWRRIAPPVENYYEQAGGAASGIAGTETTIATLVLPTQGYPYRAKVWWTCYVGSSDTTSTFKARVRRDTANTGTLLRESIGFAGSGNIPVPVCHLDVSPDASVNLFGSIVRQSGSGTGQTFADPTSDILTVTTIPL